MEWSGAVNEYRGWRRIYKEFQTVRAHTRISNDSNVRAALISHKWEQFGIIVNIFAHSDNFNEHIPETPLPQPLPTEETVVNEANVGQYMTKEEEGMDEGGI